MDEKRIEELIEQLKDSDPEVRNEAVETLYKALRNGKDVSFAISTIKELSINDTSARLLTCYYTSKDKWNEIWGDDLFWSDSDNIYMAVLDELRDIPTDINVLFLSPVAAKNDTNSAIRLTKYYINRKEWFEAFKLLTRPNSELIRNNAYEVFKEFIAKDVVKVLIGVKTSTAGFRKYKKGKERKQRISYISDFTSQIRDILNKDKKSFPVERQELKRPKRQLKRFS